MLQCDFPNFIEIEPRNECSSIKYIFSEHSFLRITMASCSLHIRCYSGPYFPGVSLRIQSECRKMWTRITPNINSFQVVAFVKMRSQVA